MGLTRLNSKMIELPAELENIIADNITTNIINGDTAVFQNLSAINVVFDSADYNVITITEPIKIFTNSDNTKAYHFNTLINDISAVFPDSLNVGFNVTILNTSTGFIYLSSTDLIQATGQFNNTPFTGMFIYKADDGLFYGVGVFE